MVSIQNMCAHDLMEMPSPMSIRTLFLKKSFYALYISIKHPNKFHLQCRFAKHCV